MESASHLADLFNESFVDLLRISNLSPLYQRLFELVALGRSGPHSVYWSQEFISLGCLHLLVLSGSQASSLVRASFPVRNLIFQRMSTEWGLLYSWLFALKILWIYGTATGWSPPLTRGLILCAFFAFPWRLHPIWVTGLAFLVHALSFPEHLHVRGFYLSWIASLLLVIGGTIWDSLLLRQLFQSLCCTLLMFWMGIDIELGSGALFLWLLACLVAWNLILGLFFDQILQPLICFLLLSALAGAFLKMMDLEEIWRSWIGGMAFFLRPFLATSAHTLLVALKSFRYIQEI
jgi:hypothetical protein